jgi:hypothetical protein
MQRDQQRTRRSNLWVHPSHIISVLIKLKLHRKKVHPTVELVSCLKCSYLVVLFSFNTNKFHPILLQVKTIPMIVMIMKWTCILKMFPLLITLQVYIKLDIFILCLISLFTSYCIESKDSGLKVLRKKLVEQLIASELEAMSDSVSTKEKARREIRKSEVDLDNLWSEKESVALESFKLYHSCMGFCCLNCLDQRNQIVN